MNKWKVGLIAVLMLWIGVIFLPTASVAYTDSSKGLAYILAAVATIAWLLAAAAEDFRGFAEAVVQRGEVQMEREEQRDKNLKVLREMDLSASSLVFTSFRYYLGRQTAATCAFACALANGLDCIDEDHQRMIVKEITEAIALGHAGSAIDVEQWEKVLRKWYGTCESCDQPCHNCVCSHEEDLPECQQESSCGCSKDH